MTTRQRWTLIATVIGATCYVARLLVGGGLASRFGLREGVARTAD